MRRLSFARIMDWRSFAHSEKKGRDGARHCNERGEVKPEDLFGILIVQ